MYVYSIWFLDQL